MFRLILKVPIEEIFAKVLYSLIPPTIYSLVCICIIIKQFIDLETLNNSLDTEKWKHRGITEKYSAI